MKQLVSSLITFLFLVGMLSCSKLQEVDDVCTTMDDIKFMDYCYKNFDVNSDGKVSMSEATAVKTMNVSNKGITSLKGIEYFTALTELNCGVNDLSTLNISKNLALSLLICRGNPLVLLDVSKNSALTDLDCRACGLSNLDVSKNSELRHLICNNNNLTSLDVSKNTELIRLECFKNNLTSFDVSKNTKLRHLDCYDNSITYLDVSSTELLRYEQLFNYGSDFPSNYTQRLNLKLTLVANDDQYKRVIDFCSKKNHTAFTDLEWLEFIKYIILQKK